MFSIGLVLIVFSYIAINFLIGALSMESKIALKYSLFNNEDYPMKTTIAALILLVILLSGIVLCIISLAKFFWVMLP